MKIITQTKILIIIILFSLSACASPRQAGTSISYSKKFRINRRISSPVPVAFSRDGRFFAKGDGNSIHLIDPSTGNTTLKLEHEKLNTISSLAFSPEGKYLAAGSFKRIYIWDMTKNRWVKFISAHKNFITSLVFNSKGDILASGSKGIDIHINLWNTKNWKNIRMLDPDGGYKYSNYIQATAFSLNGEYFASAGLDKIIRIWKLSRGTLTEKIKTGNVITALAFNHDSSFLVSGGLEGIIELWNVSNGRRVQSIKKHKEGISSIAFNKDGSYMATASNDMTISLFKLKDNSLYDYDLSKAYNGTYAAFSQDLHTAAGLGKNGEISFYPLLGASNKKGGIPPIISILTPQHNSTIEKEEVWLRVKIKDDKGIKKIDYFINGIKTGKGTRDLKIAATPQNSEMFERNISLIEGENRIMISAIDVDNLTSTETITVNRKTPKREMWGAVIGISRYKNIEDLKYADKDAEAFYDYMRDNIGIPEDHLFKLINQDATINEVKRVLGDELKKRAGKDDTVFIFYAGHGAPEPDSESPDGDGLEKYLLPYDADPMNLYSSALPMAEVSKIMRRIKAERLIFIADTCFSGASRGGEDGTILASLKARANISNSFLDRISKSKGRVILTASEANEVSQELHEYGHGVFTYYFLKGLKGAADRDKNGEITIDEVYQYVSKKVPDATGQDQHPVIRGEYERGDLIIGRVEEYGTPHPNPLPAGEGVKIPSSSGRGWVRE